MVGLKLPRKKMAGGGLRRPVSGPIKLVGALLEGLRELAEGRIEHRAHDRSQEAAAELVVDEESDDRSLAVGLVAESPDVFHVAERAVDIFHEHAQASLVQVDAACEVLADKLVTDRHVGD